VERHHGKEEAAAPEKCTDRQTGGKEDERKKLEPTGELGSREHQCVSSAQRTPAAGFRESKLIKYLEDSCTTPTGALQVLDFPGAGSP